MSDRMALLHAKGEMAVGDQLTGVSIIGSEFHGKILGEKWSAKQPQFDHKLADSAGSRGRISICWTPAIPGPKATALTIPGHVTNENLNLWKLNLARTAKKLCHILSFKQRF
jgi:hypothetical protein